MISAVIATLNDEDDLVGALGPLVPGSMEGLVRELIVADAGSTDATLAIAEDAGAVIVAGGLDQACRAAKGPWLLILTPKARLYPTWLAAARGHIERSPDRAARLTKPGLFARTEALLIPKALHAAGKTAARRLVL